MKALTILLPYFFVCAWAAAETPPSPSSQFVSTTGREATMIFDHFVEFSGDPHENSKVLQKRARAAIERQVKFMIGSLRGRGTAPKGDHQITEIELTGPGKHVRTLTASYHYEGTVQIRNDIVGPPPFLLPTNPSRFYWDGIVRDGVHFTAPCTKKGYRWPSDLFYYWHPHAKGCPWKKGEDFEQILPKLEFKTISGPAYPEYERLADPQTSTITMWILIGPADSSNSMDPLTSKDINAKTFRELRAHFLEQGFSSRPWTERETRKKGAHIGPDAYVEEFEKQGARTRVRINAFYGHTAVKDFSRPFYNFLEDAVENASMVVYAGHAGLGNTLKPTIAERIGLLRLRPNKDRYQIYFFNGCSTYTYYTLPYFKRKATPADPEGTSNLDIMSTGLATGEDFLGSSSLALINAVTGWADGGPRLSYQEILQHAGGTNLLSVSGAQENSVTDREAVIGGETSTEGYTSKPSESTLAP